MGSTTAFQCDGPGCNELTTRRPNTRFPDAWPRLTLQLGEATKKGAFHAPQCAQAWVERELGEGGAMPVTSVLVAATDTAKK